MTRDEKTSILKQYDKMVWRFVHRVNRKKWLSVEDEEELANDFRMAIWKCLDKFDPSKASLTTWINNSIRLKLSTFLFNRFHRNTKSVDRNSITFSSLQFTDDEYSDAIDRFAQESDEAMIGEISLRMMLDSIPNKTDADVLRRWVCGETFAEIAEDEKCTPQNIGRRITKARKWLRENMEQ